MLKRKAKAEKGEARSPAHGEVRDATAL